MQNDDVLSQLQSAGLVVDAPLVLGKLVRVPLDARRKAKKDGWYWLFEHTLRNGERVIAGGYGNWSTGFAGKIERNTRGWSDSEKAEYRQRMQDQRAAQEQAQREKEAECAARAKDLWERVAKDSGPSDYLRRKKVFAFGVRFLRGTVVVPVRRIEGALVGLQFIPPDGKDKRFLTGTPKKGGFHLIGEYRPDVSRVIGVAEGYATAASIHMATQWPVAVAFDAGNLVEVTKALRQLYPDAFFVVCGDDDHERVGRGCLVCGHFLEADKPNYKRFDACPKCDSKDCCDTNIGRVKAEAAARRVAGRVAFPRFREAA